MKPRNAIAAATVIGSAILAFGSTTPVLAAPTFSNLSSAQFLHPALSRLTKALDLTATEVSAIQTIIAAERLAAKPLHQQIAADRLKIAEAVIMLPYDSDTINPLATQLGTDQANLVETKAQAENQVYALLTSAQQALFVKVQPLVDALFR